MSTIKSRGDVVDEVAALSDLPQKKVDEIIRAYEQTIMRQAASGGEIRMTGFGTFKITHRAARTSRNPQTGEPVEVSERNAIRFVPGQALKDAAASSLKDDKPKAKTVEVEAATDEIKAEKKEKKSKKKSKS